MFLGISCLYLFVFVYAFIVGEERREREKEKEREREVVVVDLVAMQEREKIMALKGDKHQREWRWQGRKKIMKCCHQKCLQQQWTVVSMMVFYLKKMVG